MDVWEAIILRRLWHLAGASDWSERRWIPPPLRKRLTGQSITLWTTLDATTCSRRLAERVSPTFLPQLDRPAIGTVSESRFVIQLRDRALMDGILQIVAFGTLIPTPGGTTVLVRYAVHPLLLLPVVALFVVGSILLVVVVWVIVFSREHFRSDPLPYLLMTSVLPFLAYAYWIASVQSETDLSPLSAFIRTCLDAEQSKAPGIDGGTP